MARGVSASGRTFFLLNQVHFPIPPLDGGQTVSHVGEESFTVGGFLLAEEEIQLVHVISRAILRDLCSAHTGEGRVEVNRLSHNKYAAGRVGAHLFGGGAQEEPKHLRKPGMAHQDHIKFSLLSHLEDRLSRVPGRIRVLRSMPASCARAIAASRSLPYC